jgi:Tfp pilus assembly protein PilZ
MSDASIDVRGLHDAVRLARQLNRDGLSDGRASARLADLKRYIEILTQYDATPCDDLVFAIDDSHPTEPTHHIQVTWPDAGGLWKAVRRNINKDGVFLRTDQLPSMGAKVVLTARITDPEVQFVIRTKVIWVNPHERSGRPMGMGLKFNWPDDADRTLLRSFMEGDSEATDLRALG